MTTASQFLIDPVHVDQSWLTIVRRHHEAKALARCGKKEQANSLLRDTLPPLIRQWGAISGLPRHMQILRLRKLLRGDLSNLLSPKRKAPATQAPTPTPAPVAPMHAPQRGRIPLSDISGMIDAVHLAEAQSRPALRLAS